MKISIIIPVYNAEKYIKKCLDSVINQTYTNLEIILVDDGSQDNGGKICDEYSQKDKRIKILHKTNQGVSEARNSGINMVTGEYFYLLDADDFIDLDTINIFQKRAKETHSDILIGKLTKVDENGIIVERGISFDKCRIEMNDLVKSKEKFKFFFGKSYGACAGNKLYRFKFVESLNIKFEKDIYFGEDLLFNLKLYINAPRIELINEQTYYYLRNRLSITYSYKKDLSDRYLDLVTNFYNYAEKNNMIDGNQDLISYNSFTAIDNTYLNCFEYSKNPFRESKREISKFKKSIIINSGIKNLAKGKYLKEVSRKDWKYFVRIFSVLYNLNFMNLAALLQLCRYKYKVNKTKTKTE